MRFSCLLFCSNMTDDFRKKIAEMKEKIYSSSELEREAKESTTSASKRTSSAMLDMESLTRQCDAVRRKISQTDGKLQQAEASLTNCQAITSENRKTIDFLKGKEEERHEAISDLEKKLAVEKKKHYGLTSNFESLRSKQQLLNGQIVKAKDLASEREMMANILMENLSQQKAKLQALNIEHEKGESVYDEVDSVHQELSLKITESEKRVEAAKVEIDHLEKRLSDCKEESRRSVGERQKLEFQMQTILDDLDV